MIEKPVVIPINEQVKEQIGMFLQVFTGAVNKELLELEQEVESIKNVLKHHGRVE
jgi:16S rRNA C1402 N4-methylase RsmH